jgi:hypothetical protein
MNFTWLIMKKLYLLIIAIILATATLIPHVQGDMWDPFHTKQQKISMWKNLWDTHANTSYTSIGKTAKDSDIWLFTTGNPDGEEILWDGELHGNEDKGSELLFLIAQWLLESNDPLANQILETTYIMFIPVVNDMDARGNGNTKTSTYGVDLNRNFATGWAHSNPNSDLYSGDHATSEPETQALRNVFSTYKPLFYVNLHCGAGPYAAQYSGGNLTLGNQVVEGAKTNAIDLSVTPYSTRAFGSNGFAIGDAVALGVQSAWLIETVGSNTAWRHLPEDYNELETTYFPKCLAIFIAMYKATNKATNNNPPTITPTPSQTPIPSPLQPTPPPTATSSPLPTPNPTLPPSTQNQTPLSPQSLASTSNSMPELPKTMLTLMYKPASFIYTILVALIFAVTNLTAAILRKRK